MVLRCTLALRTCRDSLSVDLPEAFDETVICGKALIWCWGMSQANECSPAKRYRIPFSQLSNMAEAWCR